MSDPFLPHRELPKRLYLAFQNEAKNRSKYRSDEWIEKENIRVWEEAKAYAQEHNLIPPTLEEIRSASTYASGHVDYGSKWAHEIERILLKKQKP